MEVLLIPHNDNNLIFNESVKGDEEVNKTYIHTHSMRDERSFRNTIYYTEWSQHELHNYKLLEWN